MMETKDSVVSLSKCSCVLLLLAIVTSSSDHFTSPCERKNAKKKNVDGKSDGVKQSSRHQMDMWRRKWHRCCLSAFRRMTLNPQHVTGSRSERDMGRVSRLRIVKACRSREQPSVKHLSPAPALPLKSLCSPLSATDGAHSFSLSLGIDGEHTKLASNLLPFEMHWPPLLYLQRPTSESCRCSPLRKCCLALLRSLGMQGNCQIIPKRLSVSSPISCWGAWPQGLQGSIFTIIMPATAALLPTS